MADPTSKRCKQEGCPYNSGGACLEGFANQTPPLCPNLIDPSASLPAESIAVQISEPSKRIRLASGRAFSVAEASKITLAVPTTFVVLAGAVSSGKTTLIAELFERYLKSDFAGTMFCGSETLLGFEERCHLSRIESGQDEPDTERTKRAAEDVFLHLALSMKSDSTVQHLLLYDISGELYEAAAQASSAIDENPVIARSDFFLLLLDGKKLAKAAERHKVENDAAVLLRACIEKGVLGKRSRVAAVFTKQDAIQDLPEKASVEAFQNALFKRLHERHSNQLAELRSFHIAARRKNKLVPEALGLDEIVQWWVSVQRTVPTFRLPSDARNTLRREIDRFTFGL
jgi:hypothetical protein